MSSHNFSHGLNIKISNTIRKRKKVQSMDMNFMKVPVFKEHIYLYQNSTKYNIVLFQLDQYTPKNYVKK